MNSNLMVRLKSTLTLTVTFLSLSAYSEIPRFEVLGVSAGTPLEQASSKLANEFPPEQKLATLFPESKFTNYSAYRCKDKGDSHYCSGQLVEYDLNSNMIRSEDLSLNFAQDKKLFLISHNYVARIADNYDQCKTQVNDYLNELSVKYGAPTDSYDRQPIRVGNNSDHYGNFILWKSDSSKDQVSVSIGCTKNGKFLKTVSVQAYTIKEALAKPITKTVIR